MIDYRKSSENFFADTTGNVYLDLYCQGGSLPLGYNHDYMLSAVSSTSFDQYLLQKPVTQKYPPHDFYVKLRTVLAPISPPGLPDIVLTGTSPAHALEAAIKNAILVFAMNRPLPPKVSILTFEGSSHGRSIATLALSQERTLLQKLPSVEAVTVPFPTAKLPISMHTLENSETERKTMCRIMEVLDSCQREKPVAAIVVEPIQNLNNNFASREFYRALRELAKARKIPLVVNEVHTGCGATGKFWASEHWAMEDVGDFLVFGKKCHLTGYFTKPDYRPLNRLELVDDWNDVGWRLIQLEAVLKGIRNRSLLPRTANTGAYLRSELEKIAANKRYIKDVRGQGTFIGFDVVRGHEEALKLINYLKEKGVHVKLFGETTVGLRPALVLDPKHAYHLLKAMEEYPYKETITPLL